MKIPKSKYSTGDLVYYYDRARNEIFYGCVSSIIYEYGEEVVKGEYWYDIMLENTFDFNNELRVSESSITLSKGEVLTLKKDYLNTTILQLEQKLEKARNDMFIIDIEPERYINV